MNMQILTYDEVACEWDALGAQSLGESGYKVNFLFFNALNQLLANSFTCHELFTIVDYYSDVVLGKRPEVALFAQKDRITGLCRLFPVDPKIEKFSAATREVLAFTIFYAYCIQYFDEERQEILNGIVQLSSLEEVLKLYNFEKQNHPERFPLPKSKLPIPKGKFGYSAENPVQTASVSTSYSYLNRLCAKKGEIISYQRCGSFTNHAGHIVDMYEIKVKQKKFLFFNDFATYKIYIDPYSQNISEIAPADFLLK